MPASPTSIGGATAADVGLAACKIRFRRALTLLAMTLAAPGSAQLVAGNRRVGLAALRLFGILLGVTVILGAMALFWRGELITVFTSLTWLRILRFALVAVAIGWALLILDAWRIADPLGLEQRQRLTVAVLNGVSCFGLTGALLFASHLVAVQRDFIESVFGSGDASSAAHGRYNVLLLGGDAGPDRVGLRPDSITVASIDEVTGRTVLFGLPRNLADVPFPPGTVMHEQFPHGFDCDGCYLNGVNTWATDHSGLFGKTKDPGIEATTQAVEEITGLTINYYALVDLKGFQNLVDAVGGVTIDVGERIPIGGVGGPITGWIEPGKQHLDGYQTLWYARSRATSDDYSRMARQKCVMNAMLQQLDPAKVVANFADIVSAGKQIISTSVPASELDTFVKLALKTRALPLSTVSFVPPRIDTGHPDWGLIRSMVSAAVAASETKDDGTPRAGSFKKRHHDANSSADLADNC